MKAALALETDAGARITRAEEIASVSHDATGLAKFAEGLQGKPLPAQRQKLISDLMSATGAVRTAATAAETMAFGIAYGVDSLQPRERRIGEARIRAHPAGDAGRQDAGALRPAAAAQLRLCVS